MNPKCPWCGDEIITRKTDGHWTHECANNCYSSCWYSTESEALAAASKRFMPKRSVKDIKNKWRQLINLRNAELNSMHNGKVLSDSILDSWWDISLAKMITRIADYIYGVTE